MARRALTVPHLKAELKWLNSDPGHFQFALGGDGAPINKAKNLTMIMVSFLNSGKRVGSPSENFVLAAGEAEELDPVWLEVVRQAVAEAAEIAGRRYTVCGMECRFTARLVPADMKWLAHFPGELPNSATYFSTFAYVSLSEMQLANQTFTMRADEKAAFHPWTFEKRMEDVAAVQTFLESCPDSWNQTRRHDAVLSFLAKERKSRQETQPALGKLIQSATVDPLHAMNNAWEHLLSCIVS